MLIAKFNPVQIFAITSIIAAGKKPTPVAPRRAAKACIAVVLPAIISAIFAPIARAIFLAAGPTLFKSVLSAFLATANAALGAGGFAGTPLIELIPATIAAAPAEAAAVTAGLIFVPINLARAMAISCALSLA